MKKYPINNTLFLILARSGSKGVPNKNIKKLDGIHLFGYRIKSALSVTSSENVWVSTDSERYADIAKGYGATVPFIRPIHLAKDDSTSIEAVLHGMNYYEKNYKGKYKYICLLEPTSPFTKYSDILKAYEEIEKDNDIDGVVSVKLNKTNTFFVQEQSFYLQEIATRMKMKKDIRRQNFTNQITPSGGFYFFRWNIFKRKKMFYTEKTKGYLVSEMSSINIDNQYDWIVADLLARNVIDKKDIYNLIK